ncbi:MAG TPA: hypothetical protein PLJ00_02495 [Chitinophagales bacterium]|nr:hypothetical protein [Chitinophagales bacterium]HRG26733.1 hypothetical protein [Chitinophagales bacterium]HRG85728.1 hypothetical protein [Chitinophagales bacterium]HRH51671.1 hypothetical protein [Chitinophagales bacterium]
MKKLMLIIALVVAGSLIASANNNNNLVPVYGIENGDQISGVGTMMLKGDIWVIRVTDNEGVVDYCPMNLPQNFQKAGLIVKFSGTVKYISDTDRLAGMPLILSQIKLAR